MNEFIIKMYKIIDSLKSFASAWKEQRVLNNEMIVLVTKFETKQHVA